MITSFYTMYMTKNDLKPRKDKKESNNRQDIFLYY